MCGIAGFVAKDGPAGPQRRSHVLAMTEALVHRGPDAAGIWDDADAGVVLGHRRLSVIDLSPEAGQPMLDPDSGIVVVHNGEIYNFRELRRELEAIGVTFRTESDTEVLLRGYRHWGEEVLKRLVGMFAFAIWDPKARTLFAARDRLGEKPLYYAPVPDGVLFASELGSLRAVPEVARAIDHESVALYLRWQYVPAPWSVFTGVRKLSPGHALRVRAGALATWRYWDPLEPGVAPRSTRPDSELLDDLEARIAAAVRLQLVSDVPLGAFLSGGVDSSLIVALMAKSAGARVRTFTIGFDVESHDESAHAAAVARHLGTEHTAEYLGQRDALDLIPKLPAVYGEPFADSSALPTQLVSKVARDHVTVSLSGDGGDEAFGGYQRYWLQHRLRWATRVPAWLAPLLRGPIRLLPGRFGRGSELIGRSEKALYRRLVNTFWDEELLEMGIAPPPMPEFSRAWDARSESTPYRRAMLADLLTYLPEAILTKVDRAAMSVSLETRAPLLDHRVVEAAIRLPDHLVWQKLALKQLASRHVPAALLDRPKQGFGVPLSRWFRDELAGLLRECLVPELLEPCGIREMGPVRRLVSEHGSGRRNHAARLWSLLVLALWSRDRGV